MVIYEFIFTASSITKKMSKVTFVRNASNVNLMCVFTPVISTSSEQIYQQMET